MSFARVADYVELASDVAETKFFQFLFGQQVVDKLARRFRRHGIAIMRPCGCTSAANSRSGCTVSTAFTAIP